MSYRSEKVDAALRELHSEIENDLRTLASDIVQMDRLRTVTNELTQQIVEEHAAADLSIALLQRDRDKIDWLLSQGCDLSNETYRAVVALDRVGYTCGEFKSYGIYRLHPERDHVLYPRWLLKEISTLDAPHGQLKFWTYIGLYDERSIVRELAANRIAYFGDSEDAKNFYLKRKKIERESTGYERECSERTQDFRRRLHRLFDALENAAIFGVDAYNGGWSPHDHWSATVVDEFFALSKKKQDFFKGRWPDDNWRVCYVDTQWEVEQASEKVGLREVRGGPCESVLCFYGGVDSNDTEKVAELIVNIAPDFDLIASWNGNIESAIVIEAT